MKNFLLFLIFLLFTAISGFSQVGAHVHAGVVSANFQPSAITPLDMTHPGYRVGVDARLLKDKMYFMLGVHYYRYSLTAQEASIAQVGEVFSYDQYISQFHYRFGLGYRLLKLPMFSLRAKTMVGALDFQYSDSYDLPGELTSFKQYIPTADLGIGIELAFLTLDVEYQIGLSETVEGFDDTKLKMWSATVGVFF